MTYCQGVCYLVAMVVAAVMVDTPARNEGTMDYGKLRFGPGKLKIHTYRLESVGTILTYDGMTYPMEVDGSADYDNGIHLRDIRSSDWVANLSPDDRKTVDTVLGSPNYRATLK